MRLKVLQPDWPAPANVHAALTLRHGGVSPPPYDSLNLAAHVGDQPEAVAENRRRLREHLNLPGEPFWLQQVHGNEVIRIGADGPGRPDRQADACITDVPGVVCAVLTADCLPVLLASTDGRKVAAAHAGWRGLAAGILESTVAAMQAPARTLIAWLGPAISQKHFEVGDEVREVFLRADPADVVAFIANERRRWQADLYQLARRRLQRSGVDAVYGGEHCTYAQARSFFSYRRDGRCGRMAALIWTAGRI